MTRKSDETPQRSEAQIREDRLKAQLKANLARRKAQTRARKASEKEQD
ncbi:hypothetical protein [Brevirhabdus sp.]